ncbi:MAG: histidine kinase dimerization/phospho-acceptor domain-containing protein, partial [Dehalococcoidales bacterium]|nr:histidine kinase dimerization/phospho-acceptor domain-containing protein [Dehalococcoidales bacterium]
MQTLDTAQINRNTLILLLFLILPAAVMAAVLFLWPGLNWVSAIPYTAIETLGSFIPLLLAVFVLARYQNRPVVLYFSAGLIGMAIINGFQIVTAPRTNLFVWLNASAGMIGGILFTLAVFRDRFPRRRRQTMSVCKETGLVLCGASLAAFAFGAVSVAFAPVLPLTFLNDRFTALGLTIIIVPVIMLVFSGSVFYLKYRRSGAREFFLFSAIVIYQFQALETLFFTDAWSIIWWMWQSLRLIVYVVALSYVLKEYFNTSESLVTEVAVREKAQTALRKAEEDWRNSFNSLDEAMLIISDDHIIERMNLTGLKLLGLTGNNYRGKHCREVFRGSVHVCAKCPMTAALHTGKSQSVEIYDESLGGHFLIKASPIIDEQGQITKFTYVIRDITAEIKAREKEKSLQQELNLTSRLASIGELAAGIAHEINNPLTSVIGFAQMLKRMDVPENMREGIDVIHDGALRT